LDDIIDEFQDWMGRVTVEWVVIFVIGGVMFLGAASGVYYSCCQATPMLDAASSLSGTSVFVPSL
jgi:hypothetical protein